MKRWHKSMKRKPKAYNDIVIIWNNGDVSINALDYDKYGCLCIENNKGYYDWRNAKHFIQQWAYVDKYFEKELK